MRAFALAAVLVVTPALAEPMVAYRKQPMVVQHMVQCDTRANILEFLKRRFGESRAAHGLSGPPERRRFVELFAGPAGSWTIVETLPGGGACLIRAGSDWHTVPKGTRL